MDWTDGYFGELYLDSIDDLLTPALSALEAETIAGLLGVGPGDRVLDMACGHGRHLQALAGRPRAAVGLERSGRYLRRAAAAVGRAATLVRGDLRALPFRAGAFDAIYSWYASLFMWEDAANAAALAELGRVLRPGGRALVHHANPARLAAEPVASARRELPGGAVVEELARFDPRTGVERARRRLRRPDGSVLEGEARLRYYRADEWPGLAAGAGLRLTAITSTTGRVGPDAPDLVAVLARP